MKCETDDKSVIRRLRMSLHIARNLLEQAEPPQERGKDYAKRWLDTKRSFLRDLCTILLLLGSTAVLGDVVVSWDENPAEENVVKYNATLDSKQTLSVTAPEVRCSQFGVDCEDGEQHVMTLDAENAAGFRSDPVNVPFGPPSPPAGVSVIRQ